MDVFTLLVGTLEEGLKAGNLWALSEKVLMFITAYMLLRKQFKSIEEKIDKYGGKIIEIEKKQVEDTKEMRLALEKLELQVHFMTK